MCSGASFPGKQAPNCSLVIVSLMAWLLQVAVRCEEITISGGIVRQKAKFDRFLNKRSVSNPRHGAIKFRAPGRILWRTIRGMIPHKTPRGAAALERLKCFEGVPHPYDKVKRLVVPDALKVLRLQHGHRNCKLGDLATLVRVGGWAQQQHHTTTAILSRHSSPALAAAFDNQSTSTVSPGCIKGGASSQMSSLILHFISALSPAHLSARHMLPHPCFPPPFPAGWLETSGGRQAAGGEAQGEERRIL